MEKFAIKPSTLQFAQRVPPCIQTVEACTLVESVDEAPEFSDKVLDTMKTTRMDMWAYSERELVFLMAHMFSEFNLIEEFQIDTTVLFTFLNLVKDCYNKNPFHNFHHGFCVTQMVNLY